MARDHTGVANIRKVSPGNITWKRPWPVYKRLLRYVWPQRLMFAWAMLGMALFAVADTSFMALMRPLLDGSFVQRDPQVIRNMPWWILGLFALRGLASFLSDYGLAAVARHVVKALRAELFGHLLILPNRFYDRHASGPIVATMTYTAEQVVQASTTALTVFVRGGLTVIGLSGLMFYLDAQLALFVFLVGPCTALLIRGVGHRFRRLSTRIQDSVGAVGHATTEALKAQQLIKVYAAQDQERQRFELSNERNRSFHMKRAITEAASAPVVQTIGAVAVAAIVAMATNDNLAGHMSAGTFAAFMGAMMGLLNPMRQLSTVNGALQQGISAASNIFQLLDEPAESQDVGMAMTRCKGDIRFDEVTFSYGEDGQRPALQQISCSWPAGTTVALVGPSGSGKSTMVKLLVRFYDPDKGRILLDGHDIRALRRTDLRRQFAMVSQDTVLLNDTIARNIAYGELAGKSQEAIHEAARAAFALEFIERLPLGFETPVGEGGILLSGGQRQRIALARAFLKDAPILLLDEPTAALDSETENQIQQALSVLMRGRTTVIIAHRLSTIEQADMILVMENGQLIEQGNHEQLLARKGRYASLYRLQCERHKEYLNQELVEI